MSLPAPVFGPCPLRFLDIKHKIAESIPEFQERVTASWQDLLAELEKVTTEIAAQGSQVWPRFHPIGHGNVYVG